MTIELDETRAKLRVLMTASMLGLPDYSLDHKAARRVGRLLAEVSSRLSDERRSGHSAEIPSLDELNLTTVSR
jgi:hypothetical protein